MQYTEDFKRGIVRALIASGMSRKEFADKAEIGVFKFHYDSINSQRHPKIVAFGPQFKFHYDSINS